MIDAIILAGGQIGGSLQAAFPEVTNKAHLCMQNKMLIEHVVQAVLASPRVDKIYVVGDKAVLNSRITHERVRILAAGADVYQNFMSAAQLAVRQRVLLLTADIPLITGPILTDFIERSMRQPADICYSIVNKKDIEAFAPASVRTYAKLREGEFTGGNVFLVNVAAVENARAEIEQIFAQRKSICGLAKLVGLGFLLKLLLTKVSLATVELRASELLGCRAKAIISPYAPVGIDVDKISDWQLVKTYLEKP